MPVINRETREWGALGTRPAAGNEVYTPGEQPIASYDNWWNWAVSQDIGALDAALEYHNERHESGGDDELDLNDLTFNTAASFTGDPANATLSLIDETDGTEVAHFDLDADAIQTWPAFNLQTSHRDGAEIGDNLVRQDTGGTIYDYTTGKVPHAEYADAAGTADHADTAGDADTLDTYHASAFIRPDQPNVNPTGNWSFDTIISGDITGNAATADHADTADNASYASEAGNSDTVDGYHAEQLMSAAQQGGDWSHVATLTHSNVGTYFDQTAEADESYDLYRIAIYHESHKTSGPKSFFRVQLGRNGWVDTRTRYSWLKRYPWLSGNDQWHGGVSDSFQVGGANPQTTATTILYAACPTTVNSPGRHWPALGSVADVKHGKVAVYFTNGALETDLPDINRFRFRSDTNRSTGRITIKGQNI